MKTRNTDVGRHAAGTNPAPGAKQVFTSGDSGGKIFNPVQKPQSGLKRSTPPFVPNPTAAGTSPTVARTNYKVAGIQKFYGK